MPAISPKIRGFRGHPIAAWSDLAVSHNRIIVRPNSGIISAAPSEALHLSIYDLPGATHRIKLPNVQTHYAHMPTLALQMPPAGLEPATLPHAAQTIT